MKPIKQLVYLPTKVEDELPEIGRATFTFNEEIDTCSFLANDGSFKEWYQHFEHKPTHWLKPQEAFVFTPEQLNEYTQKVIKQASVEFANWIAYTKKHGGVKPLQEALIQYKLKSTEELFDKYLEMSK